MKGLKLTQRRGLQEHGAAAWLSWAAAREEVMAVALPGSGVCEL